MTKECARSRSKQREISLYQGDVARGVQKGTTKGRREATFSQTASEHRGHGGEGAQEKREGGAILTDEKGLLKIGGRKSSQKDKKKQRSLTNAGHFVA